VSTTVEKALQLLEALSRANGPVGVSQLGRELRLNKSTVHRLVDTLCRRGYARQDADSGRYRLTSKLWELGGGVIEGLGLRQVARPLLESVAAETQETTLLGILQDRDALVIDKVESIRPLRIASPIGERLPLHSCALGRALLAFQPPEFIEEACREFQPLTTDHGVGSPEELAHELERIRRAQCSSAYDEWQIGVAAVAAPVRDATGAIIASFCITGPTSRLVPDGLAALSERCIAAARAVSKTLGYDDRQDLSSMRPNAASEANSPGGAGPSVISASAPSEAGAASR
jgi:DNA-binding IclR family transcriptional regulator